MDLEVREEEEEAEEEVEEEEQEVSSEVDVLMVVEAGCSCWLSFPNTLRYRAREEWKE